MLDVAIVGAGLAGLSAAIHLHRQGKSVRIYEAQDNIGGRASTLNHEGFLLDKGFQVMLTAYPECQELLNYEDLQLKKFKKDILIFRHKKIERFGYPLKHPLEFFKLLYTSFLTPKDVWRLVCLKSKFLCTSPDKLLLHDHKNALMHLEQDGFSRQFIDQFFKPFLGGVLLDRSLLSTGRMVNFLLKMFFEGEAALPAKGIGAISQQMASQLPQDTIHFNHPITKIIKGEGILLNLDQKIRAKNVLLASDPWSTAKLLDLPLPPQGRSVACCYYAAEKSPLNDACLVLNGEESGLVNHLAVVSDVAPTYAPPGASLISATILEQHLHLSDDKLLEGIRKQLTDWFGSQVFNWKPLKILRINNAHPRLYPDRFWHSPNPFKIHNKLYACGDYLETPSINGALASGRKVAMEINRIQ